MKSISFFFGLLSIAVILEAQHPKPVPGYNIEEPLYYDTFPEGFMWGAATAAYQVQIVFFKINFLFLKNFICFRLKGVGMKMEKD